MHEAYLIHHGIKGQKWGVRRFQNPDGSLTSAGTRRYLKKEEAAKSKAEKTRQKKGEESKAYKKAADKADVATLRRYHSEQFDKNLSDVRAAQSRGQKIGKLILQGAVGQYAYDASRAIGRSKAMATGMNVVAGVLAGPFGQYQLYKSEQKNYVNFNTAYDRKMRR